jgi:hypothetical protein
VNILIILITYNKNSFTVAILAQDIRYIVKPSSLNLFCSKIKTSIATMSGLSNVKILVLEAVKQNGNNLQYAPDNLKILVLGAVKKNGNNLQYVPDNLKNDKDIVLAAVKQNSNALQYASEDLQNDREIILQAVKYSSRYAPR